MAATTAKIIDTFAIITPAIALCISQQCKASSGF
jgi:hypothetical protein